MAGRIPLLEEPITGKDAVIEYDRGAKRYMAPEYKYFVRKILGKGIKEGQVLDIGTGSGRLAIELARARRCRFDIVALDISPDMLDQADQNARRCGVKWGIEFVHASAADMPFEGGRFDLVISYASLHHWFNPVAVFDEVARVTKPGGHVFIRDNKRVYENLLWKAGIWCLSRFMNRRHRQNWPRAIMASYTIPEVRRILAQSKLHDYSVKSDFVHIDLCIEARC